MTSVALSYDKPHTKRLSQTTQHIKTNEKPKMQQQFNTNKDTQLKKKTFTKEH